MKFEVCFIGSKEVFSILCIERSSEVAKSKDPLTQAVPLTQPEIAEPQTHDVSAEDENVGSESSNRMTECSISIQINQPPPLESNPSQQQQPSTNFQQPGDTGCSSTMPDKLASTLNAKDTVSQAIDECLAYCKEQDISDPVEILRCAQKFIVKGKPLNGYTGAAGEFSDDRSSFILISRHDVLGTAFEEISCIEDVQLSLEVSFYGENAQDAGGPRKEFFRLCLQEIKQKYFDNGIKEHLSEDYKVVGLIMALSILQNGRFLSEDQLKTVFLNGTTSSSLTNLTQGLNNLGLCDIAKHLPTFLYLFRPSSASLLTRRKLVHILKPNFSEDGCNQRQHENVVYAEFSKYCREAAGGKRGNITLEHILQFTTATDEEPVLGFATDPSIQFVSSKSSSKWSFIPTANTCGNTLHLPCPDHSVALPVEVELFEVYDMAFCNAYFGNR